MRLTLVGVSLLGLLAVGGCGDDEEPLPMVDCGDEAVPTFSELTPVWAKCTGCHRSTASGEQRLEAPADVNFDTYEEAVEDAEDAASQVFVDEMPPEGFPELTAEEADMLYRWALCGTPQ